MKKYCPKCLNVYSNLDTCPECRHEPPLSVPEDNEPVLLDKIDYLKAEMLKPLLKDHGIPALFKGGHADAFGMNIGMRLDVISVLVPFSAYDEAKNILSMLDGAFDETSEESF
ncbi:MAG: DUF2007 domain-containing protein [Clostridia bacterium]|nr:DUF2007 domain-containing protein [Clostridia bacterium]